MIDASKHWVSNFKFAKLIRSGKYPALSEACELLVAWSGRNYPTFQATFGSFDP